MPHTALFPRSTLLTTAKNHLIELLPPADRARLMTIMEPVDLVLEEVLCEPGTPTGHVYFPTTGFISLVARMHETPGLEVGMVGSEGMLGVQLALGVDTVPLHALVQGSGIAWRAGAADFRRELEHSDPLNRIVHRYLYVLMAQMAGAAPCLRFHAIGPRLARWMLMSADRAHTATFHVTHEFLAYMLGVRRSGITVAANSLQKSGLISYQRGLVTVLDRNGLQAAACGCYASDRKSYTKVLAAGATRRTR